MTQTAQNPVQLTLEAMLTKFRESHPHLVEPFETLKPELEGGTGAQSLANLITCEVDVKTEQGFFVYSWMGKSSPFELRISKPFDPHPQHRSENQQQQVQEEPQAPPEETQVLPEAPQEAPIPQDETPEPVEAASPAEGALEPVEVTTGGMFAALADLLGESTLLMTVAHTGEQDEEPILTVTVVPQGEEGFLPVCLVGTVGELDTHFIAALTTKAESTKSVAEQVEALKAADKELEEAKKQEVAAKNKQVEAKKKSAKEKEEQVKAEEKQAEEKAEAEKQQEALF